MGRKEHGPKVKFLFEKPPMDRGLREGHISIFASQSDPPSSDESGWRSVGKKEMRFKSRLVNLHVNAREGVCIYVRVYVEVGGFIDAPETTKVPLKDRTTDLEMSSVEKELSCESDRSLINGRPFVTLAGRKIRRRRRRRPTFPSLVARVISSI